MVKTTNVNSSASFWASLVAQLVESAFNVGDLGLIPGLGRSPGGGHPLAGSSMGLKRVGHD